MKVCCGTDIIEINRIKEAIERTEGFKEKVFTKKEIEYCESKKSQKFQSYAARFAAKEAFFKAMSDVEKVSSLIWKDIEILKNKSGKPYISVKDKKIENADISLSHCKEYAIANVVILYTK